jgi:hypothetical protein
MLMVLLLLTTFSAAGEVAVLSEIHKRPGQLLADNNHIYITDYPTVYIYSMTNFSLVNSFGKRGEGPQEFKQYINVFFQDTPPDHLVVSSIGKVSFYSRDGKYIKEVKIPFGGWVFQPMGTKFLAHTLGGNAKEGYKTLNIYDPDFNKIKEIYRKEFFFDESIKKRVLFMENYRYWTYRNVVYVMAKEDFIIERFNAAGESLPPITQEYRREKCTEEHRKSVLDFFKRNARIRPVYERLKNRLVFPDYFRAIREIVLDNGKIYVLTYKRRDGKNEFYIFDLDGNLLQKTFMPIKTTNGVSPRPFTVKNGKFYQLVDNEENENWEIHITPFD